MEFLIPAVALTIIGLGLVGSILALIEFTRCFGKSPPKQSLGPSEGRPSSDR